MFWFRIPTAATQKDLGLTVGFERLFFQVCLHCDAAASQLQFSSQRPNPVMVVPAHLQGGWAQLEHFHHTPWGAHAPTKRVMHGSVVLPGPLRRCWGWDFSCSLDVFVLAQRRWGLWTWTAEQSLSKSRYARDPWKGGSMSDIWLQHAVLQPSSASVWSPEYHCQLGSNLHWAWESGTLTVSLMVSSTLLHWF